MEHAQDILIPTKTHAIQTVLQEQFYLEVTVFLSLVEMVISWMINMYVYLNVAQINISQENHAPVFKATI